MNTIMDKKTDELQKYQVSIDQKSSSVKNTDNLLAKQEAQLEALMAAQRKQSEKEESARKTAEKKAAQRVHLMRQKRPKHLRQQRRKLRGRIQITAQQKFL